MILFYVEGLGMFFEFLLECALLSCCYAGMSLEYISSNSTLHAPKEQYWATARNTTNLASVTFRTLIQRRKEQAVEVPNQDCEAQTGSDQDSLPGGV